jgi:2-keto-4-pentenoate hydratase/2-oxohepta-3-ene-1,7-dioic acid hydratase in catechol pathway
MRLVRFTAPGRSRAVLGVTDGTSVGELAADASQNMIDLIEHWSELGQDCAKAVNYNWPIAAVRLHPPVERPGKILGIGLNYAEHSAEGGLPPSTVQLWFSKPVTAVNGPYDPIHRPVVSTQLDYEAELVAVIGKRIRHASRESAREAIFGYCVGNDVSVRDWQHMTSQIMLGKSFDTHAPFGPWITTADSVNASDLALSSFVNGERRQCARTSQMIFDVPMQIEHLSKVMTLEPGDLLFTGTPAGVAAVMKPPRWLRPGDVVRVEIEQLGYIENKVEDEPRLGG